MKNTFLAHVASDLVQKAGGIENLSNNVLVFPMHRGGVFMQQELGEILKNSSKKTIVLPEFVTINDLADHLSALHTVDELTSIIDLYQIYKRIPSANDKLPIDVFYGWGKQLLDDFSDVDIALLDAENLFKNSVEAHKLEKVQIDEDTRKRLEELLPRTTNSQLQKQQQKVFEELWKQIPTMYSELNKMHCERGVGYQGARIRQVVENFGSEKIQNKIAGKTFAFIGFNYLLGAERKLMQLLQEHGHALFYWDYNAAFQTNPDAYKFIRKEMEQNNLTNSLSADLCSETTIRPVTMCAAIGSNVQAQYVHQWLTEHHHEDDRTAIVIADESMLEPVVFALPKQWSDKVNITKGFPLRDTNIYHDIISHLSNSGQLSESPDIWIGMLNDILNRCFTNESLQVQDKQGDNAQQGKIWQTELRKESEAQAEQIIRRFIALLKDKKLEDITSLATLRNLIRRYMDMVSMPFHSEEKMEIQVMGVLESRVLDFDHLLILNAEEGVLPAKASNHSFIPYYLRKYYGMQTADEQSSIFAYNFFRLLRRCADTTILFSSGASKNGKRTMSRFLMQMLVTKEFEVTKMQLVESNTTPQEAPDVFTYKSLADKWMQEDATSKKELKLSPSAITTYLGCHRRFYLQYVLGLNSTDQDEPILRNNELGSLIHGILNYVYEQLTCCQFPKEIKADDITVLFEDSDCKKLKKDSADHLLDGGYMKMNEDYCRFHPKDAEHYKRDEHPIENEVALQYVCKVLKYDVDMLKKDGYLEIVMMEQDKRIDMDVKTDDGHTSPICIGGKIDRLDIVKEDGQKYLRVLDYKTGGFSESKLRAANMDAIFADNTQQWYMLQALLYCLICDKKAQELNKDGLPITAELLFTNQNLSTFDPHLSFKEEPDNRNSSKKILMKDYHQTITQTVNKKEESFQISAEFEKKLKEKVQEIVTTTNFDQCSESNCSSYCPFHLLCGREKKEW